MTNQTQLKILFWNANCIQNKTEEFQSSANQLNLDIIIIDETKINPKTYLKIKNYHTYRTHTSSPMGNHYHEGTAVLVYSYLYQSKNQHVFNINNHLNRTPPNTYFFCQKKTQQTSGPTRSNKLINDSNWFVVCYVNAKYPLWHSCTNLADNILYNHAQNQNYSIVAPDTPTHHSLMSKNRLDILDSYN